MGACLQEGTSRFFVRLNMVGVQEKMAEATKTLRGSGWDEGEEGIAAPKLETEWEHLHARLHIHAEALPEDVEIDGAHSSCVLGLLPDRPSARCRCRRTLSHAWRPHVRRQAAPRPGAVYQPGDRICVWVRPSWTGGCASACRRLPWGWLWAAGSLQLDRQCSDARASVTANAAKGAADRWTTQRRACERHSKRCQVCCRKYC
jgi:hypothetical protein